MRVPSAGQPSYALTAGSGESSRGSRRMSGRRVRWADEEAKEEEELALEKCTCGRDEQRDVEVWESGTLNRVEQKNNEFGAEGVVQWGGGGGGESEGQLLRSRSKSWAVRKGIQNNNNDNHHQQQQHESPPWLVNSFGGQPRRLSALEKTSLTSGGGRVMDEEPPIGGHVDERLSRMSGGRQHHQPVQKSSQLIVYEWDPMYLLSQGYDLSYAAYTNSSESPLVPLYPSSSPYVLHQQPPHVNNCLPSLFAPGTHSHLLQESSS